MIKHSYPTMRPFLVCIHDTTPAYARETRVMIRDLAPFLGRRISLGVVPNWYGEWPLAAHPDYCRLVQGSSEALLLHGYFHQRQRGWGPTTLFVEGCEEMNGLDPEETRRTLEHGQRAFTEVFGEPARGFLAPAWQLGHVRLGNGNTLGLEHVLSFFSLESRAGRKVPLATWTWHCGRWDWLGHIGHGIGWLLQRIGLPNLLYALGVCVTNHQTRYGFRRCIAGHMMSSQTQSHHTDSNLFHRLSSVAPDLDYVWPAGE